MGKKCHYIYTVHNIGLFMYFSDRSRTATYLDAKSEIPPREAGDGHEEPDSVHSDNQTGKG
jgi:hypothetical protein